MVRVIKAEPDKSVVKEVICRKCGVTLEYVPMEVQKIYVKDYDGGGDTNYWIVCPCCTHKVHVEPVY